MYRPDIWCLLLALASACQATAGAAPIPSQILAQASPPRTSSHDPTDATVERTRASDSEAPPSDALEAHNPGKFRPEVIQDAVQFIYVNRKLADANVNQQPDATAFVLGIPSRGEPQKKMLRFLVTARHVLQPSWMGCPDTPPKEDPREIFVRFNGAQGGTNLEELALYDDKDKSLVLFPADNRVDLAALLLTPHSVPKLETYAFFDLPYSNLATDEEVASLTTGAQLMTAGLLPNFPGKHRNYPIFRVGTLSNTPDEAIPVACDDLINQRDVRVWLIDAMLPPGTSGAPVFTFVLRGPNSHRVPALVGVQSFSWRDQGVAAISPVTELVRLMSSWRGIGLDLRRGWEAMDHQGP